MGVKVLPQKILEVQRDLLHEEAMKKEEEEVKKIPPGTKCDGVVRVFYRTRGYGFIKLKEDHKKGIFVHSDNILTDDPCPFLKGGTKVEFEMGFDGKPKAEKVTLEGGKKVPIYTKDDITGHINEEETFTGAIKSFGGSFGFISPDKEITWNGQTCSKKVFFFRFGIVMKKREGMRPRLNTGLRVSFKVYQDQKRKSLHACEIHNEDGTPIEGIPKKEHVFVNAKKPKVISKKRKKKLANTLKKAEQEALVCVDFIADLKKWIELKEKGLKERVLIEDGRSYSGLIKTYDTKNENGTIHLNERIAHKGHTLVYNIQFDKGDSVFFPHNTIPQRGAEVMFCVYLSYNGPKACKIKNIDGSPVGSVIERNESEDAEAKKRKRDEWEETQRGRKKLKREVVNGGKTYTGTLINWSYKRKFWTIAIEDEIEYKEHHAEKSIRAHKWDLDSIETLKPEATVNFKVYLSEKGLAAFEVKVQSNPPRRKGKTAVNRVAGES